MFSVVQLKIVEKFVCVKAKWIFHVAGECVFFSSWLPAPLLSFLFSFVSVVYFFCFNPEPAVFLVSGLHVRFGTTYSLVHIAAKALRFHRCGNEDWWCVYADTAGFHKTNERCHKLVRDVYTLFFWYPTSRIFEIEQLIILNSTFVSPFATYFVSLYIASFFSYRWTKKKTSC